jgi:ribosomal protein S18 acetylase RimI-like enzyme
MDNVMISLGFAAHHRAKAAQLYYTAFRQKLHPIFRDEHRALTVLENSLNPSYAIAATVNDQLVGIAGFHDMRGNLVDIQPRDMTRVFGFIGGWVRLLGLSLFSRKPEEKTLLMDGIVVDSDMRGGGVGSKLLDAIIEHAQTQGYQQVRLNVVDTNPRARQLYERKGFVAVDSKQYPYLKRLFGFSGATTMLKTVN